MISDLEIGGEESLSADVCVIGAGPAGITIALELFGSGLRTCLFEAGGFACEERTQSLYEGASIGHPMTLTEGRYRVFGGSATRWGGRSAVMDPIDFENRDWVPNSTWPIGWNSLQPYYERAKTACNFQSPWAPDAEALASIRRVVPVFDTPEITPFVWRFATPDLRNTLSSAMRLGQRKSFDWGSAHRRILEHAADVQVLLHANLVDLVPTATGDAIRFARFKSLNGHVIDVFAGAFVICCGGIENARILLNLNEKIRPRLKGAESLGRYFTQHPRGAILTVEAGRAESLRLQRVINKFPVRANAPVQYELGFALSASAQREHRLLNASAGIYYVASENSPWISGRRLRDALKSRSLYPGMLADVKRLLLGGLPLVSNTWKKYVSGGQIVFPQGIITVMVDLEQQPRSDSCITLSNDRDRLGVRRVVVDWKVSESERTTARKFAEFISRELQRLRFGKAKLEPWLSSTAPVGEADLSGNYHFIGSTRMAKTAENGVVDENALVFGLSNLYVAGSSIFTSGGHANPTLTVVALAIRLADCLKRKLSPSEAARRPAP